MALSDLLPIPLRPTFEQLIPRLNAIFDALAGRDPDDPETTPGQTVEELRAELLAVAAAHDIGSIFAGTPATLARFSTPVVRKFTLPANAAGSRAWAETSATAEATFKIYKNAEQVGSIVFAAGVAEATLATVGAAEFEFDPDLEDILTVEAPETPDATLAQVSFTLKLSREL